MKQSSVSAVLLLSVLLASTTPASPDSTPANENARLSEITNRVFAGKYDALYEVTQMPPAIAIPYLYKWTRYRGGDKPEEYETANKALQMVDGWAGYLRADIAKILAQGGVPGRDFEIIEAIGTLEAAAVAAPYLFDSRRITMNEGEPPDSLVGWAATKLTRMKLPDAPKASPYIRSAVTLVEWQRWAIAKGLVPKEWSSRVGAPAWWLERDAMSPIAQDYSKPPTPQPANVLSSPATPATHQGRHKTDSATSADEKGAPSKTEKQAPVIKQTKNRIQTAVIPILVIVALVAGSGFLRKKLSGKKK